MKTPKNKIECLEQTIEAMDEVIWRKDALIKRMAAALAKANDEIIFLTKEKMTQKLTIAQKVMEQYDKNKTKNLAEYNARMTEIELLNRMWGK